jgi:hypothetical protein
VLRTIESLDLLVKDNLAKLAAIRKTNKAMDTRLIAKAEKVNQIMFKLQNMKKV